MITDDDRAFARDMAKRIEDNHIRHGMMHLRNHTASEISYYETLRRGILTECAFANEFGVLVSREINHLGDAGVDFVLNLNVPNGIQQFAVDVKSKTVRVSWDGLRRSGTHLRVLRRELRPLTIYVFGIYLERDDDADVLAWTWGSTLVKRNDLQRFENSTGEDNWNYVMPFEDLRPLADLKARCIEAEPVL